MSRLHGSAVCVIADGMDQMKYSLPRSPLVKSRNFPHSTGEAPRGLCDLPRALRSVYCGVARHQEGQ